MGLVIYTTNYNTIKKKKTAPAYYQLPLKPMTGQPIYTIHALEL